MESFFSKTVRLDHDSDVRYALKTVQEMADAVAFEPTVGGEVVLAVNKLATNLIKRAPGGTITLTSMSRDGRTGLMVEAVGHGPEIPDVEQILTREPAAAGLEDELGTVRRLMDEFSIDSAPGSGTRIVCWKWAAAQAFPDEPSSLDVGASTRSSLTETINGDAFVVKMWGQNVLVGVIAGMDRGEQAHHAAQTARECVEKHFDQPLDQIFHEVELSCHGTPGVMMALARFDCDREHLVFASVGNIEARVFPSTGTYYFGTIPGVIGLNARKPVVKENYWPMENTLVLFSEGLWAHWTWDDFPGLLKKTASDIAVTLLQSLARDEDDATVMVVKGMLP